MLKVCAIGIGNCGGQIAELAKTTKNIPGVAINSSEKDFISITAISKILLGDSKGAGKNRDEAKRFVKSQITNLLSQEKFTDFIGDNDVVFVVSSIGGGTGSGMAPMCTDILSRKYPEKRFILVEVYPPIRESIAAQQNSIDYLKEVRDNIPNAVYMAYDNNKYSNLPTSEMMKKVNEEIVEHMAIIRGDYLYPTPYNSIDEKDMMALLKTSGRLAIFDLQNIKEKDIDTESIESKVINVIKNISSNVELDRDKIVKQIGLITNLNQKLDKTLSVDIREIKDLIGEPVEGFEHIYISKDTDDNKVILILTGLSVPDDRLIKITQRIEEGLEEMSRTKSSSVLDSTDTKSIKDLRGNEMEGSNDLNFDDIFDRY